MDDVDLPGPAYLRLVRAPNGRWTVTELYLDGQGQPITSAMLRGFPLDALEDVLNAQDYAEQLARRERGPRPLLSEAASYYATRFGSQARHWVAAMHRAQGGDGEAPTRRPDPGDAVHVEAPPLRAPDRGLTPEFLRTVARAYVAARARRAARPAVDLAEQAGVPVRTVHRWLYLARKAGALAPAGRSHPTEEN